MISFQNGQLTAFILNLRTSFKNVGVCVRNKYPPQLKQKLVINMDKQAFEVNIAFQGVFLINIIIKEIIFIGLT